MPEDSIWKKNTKIVFQFSDSAKNNSGCESECVWSMNNEHILLKSIIYKNYGMDGVETVHQAHTQTHFAWNIFYTIQTTWLIDWLLELWFLF